MQEMNRTIEKNPGRTQQLSQWLGESLLRIMETIRGKEFYKSGRPAAEIALLYPGKAGQVRLRSFYAGKLKNAFLTILLGILLTCMAVFMRPTVISKEGKISRNTYGGADQLLPLKIQEEDGAVRAVTATVSARTYTAEQARLLLAEAEKDLEQVILGENTSFYCVDQDLYLPQVYKEVQIVWEIGNYHVCESDGRLREEEIPPEGVTFTLRGNLSCQEERSVFERTVTVVPMRLSEEEKRVKALETALLQADREWIHNEVLELPTEVEGKKVIWKEQSDGTLPALLLLTLVMALGIYWNEDQKLHTKLTNRTEQMDADYAEILNKLVLLLGAGMTIRGAWTRIAEEYEREHREERFAYEEMLLSLNELKRGIPEMQVYEHFGRRCGSASYLKLSALLTQNLKKGTRGLLELFRRESSEAFRRQKAQVRKRGEEAGTKLLLPMFLMLAVVLMIVMIPAFLSMQL